MHVPCVGSDIFGALFCEGELAASYWVPHTSERLLLEMKAKGFYFSQQFGRHFLWDFRPALALSQFPVVVFCLYLRFFWNTVLTFVYLPIFHNAHQTPHLLCFLCFSGSPISHSSIFFSSVHFPSMVCSFFIHLFFPPEPIHLHSLSISPCVQLDVLPLPIHPHTCCYSLSVLWQWLWQG